MIVGGTSQLANYFINHSIFPFFDASRTQSSTIYCDLAYLDTQVFDEYRFSHALILASITNIAYVESNPEIAYKVNYQGIIELIDYLNGIGTKCLFFSSSTVFSGSSRSQSENSPTHPNTYYGLLKCMVEDHIKLNELNTILRLTKVFSKNSILQDWFTSMNSGFPVNAFTDLKVAPLMPSNVFALVNRWICNDTNSSIIHCTSDTDLTYYDLAKRLCLAKNLPTSAVMGSLSPTSIIYKPQYANLTCFNPCSMTLSLDEVLTELFNGII
ncbi:sugar nucleotide-binding protein [Synechococcus sp. KORDI-100]|uniref:sugar nucleotide-binding protein n=1 Tax=Synechococcus sp. KORDI-100 TaxID=1280380 RepID=UPI00138E0A31|nr:sugar nucleotide-binding protein [Synechococcus sp. KORDI-100]